MRLPMLASTGNPASPLLLLLLLAGCHAGRGGHGSTVPGGAPSPEGDSTRGRVYDYVAFGTADTVTRVAGRFVFRESVERFPDSIQGTWDLQAIGDPGDVGPQTGTGSFRGEVDEAGRVRIDLNPGMADNNVFLVGAFVGGPRGSIEGDWRVSTFVGETSSGRFRAVPRGGR